MSEKTRSIIQTVTAKISSGEVQMRSRATFYLKTIALVVLGCIVFITSALIINFIIFAIHMSSTGTLLRFGPRGFSSFLFFFPWPLLIMDVVFSVLLIFLLKQFRLGYRTPLLYLFGSLILFSCASGYMIERHTPTNDFIVPQEWRERPGQFHRMMFGGMGRLPEIDDGFCRCQVLGFKDNTLILKDTRSGRTLNGVLGESVYGTTSTLRVNDLVLVAGDVDDDVFTIFGIRTIGNGIEMRRGDPRE